MIIEDKFELLNIAVDTQCNCGETDCQWYETTITYKALLHKDEIQELKELNNCNEEAVKFFGATPKFR